MTTIIAFDGLSGTGKSSVSLAVSERLRVDFTTQWVHHSSAFGMKPLRQLLFSQQAEFGIDKISYRHLREVFFRQYYQHLIEPHLGNVDVLLLDNPCFGEIGFATVFEGADFVYKVDLMVVTHCHVAEIPFRVATREAGAYEVNLAEYRAGGEAWKCMETIRESLNRCPDVLGIDTTHRTVDESADIVLSECERRFGWHVTALREPKITTG